MIPMIELPDDLQKGTMRFLGWKVSISRRVWLRCVRVPEGVEGQTEEGRLNDLLLTIKFNLRWMAAAHPDGFSAAYGFTVNVVNDSRMRRDHPDGLECPGEEVPIEVFAGICGEGGPHLTVLAHQEIAQQAWSDG